MVISGKATMQGLRATKKGMLLEEMAESRAETSKMENEPKTSSCSKKSGNIQSDQSMSKMHRNQTEGAPIGQIKII